MGSAGVLLGARSLLVSVRLAAVVHSAARLDAVPQVRVCHRLAVQGAHGALPVPARTVESGNSLADAHLQIALGRHGVRIAASYTCNRLANSATAASAHVTGDNNDNNNSISKYDNGRGTGNAERSSQTAIADLVAAASSNLFVICVIVLSL